jgi:hypothetical protein
MSPEKTEKLAQEEGDRHSEILPTSFVTKQQTAALMQVLELAMEDLDHVSGGLAKDETCQCVNCCSHAA